MAATPSTTAERVAPLALQAVTDFMVTRGLPAPLSIGTPRGRGCCDAIRILVDERGTDFEAWSDAITGVYQGTDTMENDGQHYAVVTERGTVPSAIGDVAVVLRIVQQVEPQPNLSLQLVETRAGA